MAAASVTLGPSPSPWDDPEEWRCKTIGERLEWLVEENRKLKERARQYEEQRRKAKEQRRKEQETRRKRLEESRKFWERHEKWDDPEKWRCKTRTVVTLTIQEARRKYVLKIFSTGANLEDFLTIENASVVSLEDVPSLDVDDIESSEVSEDSHSAKSELESDAESVPGDEYKLGSDEFGDSGDEDFLAVQNASSLEDLSSSEMVDSPTPNDPSAASQTEQQQEENEFEIELERLPEWRTRYDDDEMDYWTSLHLACYYNWVHKVDIYVDSPLTQDAQDQPPSDASPASPARKMKMLQYEYRATNINGQTEEGETPLLVACEMGHVEVVRKLLAYRDIIDVNIQDKAGRTPLSVARHNGHHQVVTELLNFGSDVD